MEKIALPKSLLSLPEHDREAIVKVLLEATKLPKVKDIAKTAGSERSIWARNGDDLLADIEDAFYVEMVDNEAKRLAELCVTLGIIIDDVDIEKAFEPEFHAFEDVLVKSIDSGRSRMSTYIRELASRSKKQREKFMQWMDDGKALTSKQLKRIDEILKKELPNYQKRAEDYMVRAGFVGKIRGEADRENFETLGALIDRYPSTIKQATDRGVVLTLRHQQKEEAKGRKVTILPLTPQETDAVRHATLHAGDKLTEISDRHISGVRQLVIQAKRERWSVQRLAQALFDAFGDHNRDWRRVAITELAFATNDAYLSGCSEGDTLVGMGAVDACKHCQNLIIGKQVTFTERPPKKESYKTDTEVVWIGKSNYGRRVSEYVAAVPLHPSCRCRWHRISRFYKLDNDGKLVLKDTAELINEERAKRGLPPDKSLEGTQEERLKKLTEAFLKNNA